MFEALIQRIADYAPTHSRASISPPANEGSIIETEERLGFQIPELLKLLYLRVGNGGFGPGYGVIGLKGGHLSIFGDLFETYEALKGGHEEEGEQWNPGLLPFCEWGCNIYSCVSCKDSKPLVYLFDSGDIRPQIYILDIFFELWLKGLDILSLDETEIDISEIINPFTGKKTRVTKRKKKDK